MDPNSVTTRQSNNELSLWLVLRRIMGFGPRRFAELLGVEESLSNCFNGSEPRSHFIQWCQQKGLNKITLDWKGVEKDLAWAQNPSHHIVTFQDEAYPEQLKQIPQFPPVLFIKGNLDLLKTQQMAIVGTRNPSQEGQKNAYAFASQLAQVGFTITSGLALGIDGASHEGALSKNGHTIAVLGNGLDTIYPAKHHTLGSKISERGALVSEFPVGTPAKKENFPQRNRIISGLSMGVLVVESALKSGSLITANYALDQGREIFALPGSIHNPMAKGCHQLIRQGAKCVESIEHIIEEFPHCSNQVFQPNKESLNDASLIQQSQLKEELPSQNKQFLAHISDVCTPIDTVVDRTGLTVTEVSQMLLQLEIEGRVTCVPGGYIRVGTGVDKL